MAESFAAGIYKKLRKSEIIVDSDLFTKDEPPTQFLNTGIISMNCACSGRIDGGFAVGKLTVFSADSMLGKTIIGMCAIRHAQKLGLFCVVLDAEYQWDWKIAASIGIDPSQEKIIVIPNNQIEEVQEKIMQITGGLTHEERGKLCFMLDSWGALVNYEGVKKAGDAESKKDFTLTQKKNNLANMILHTRSTFYVTNGVYDNVGGFGDPLKIPGGKRLILNAHTVILGKSKAKDQVKTGDEKELHGAIISCMMHKARYGREKTEFKFRINYDGGLDIFYGILDYAIEGGYVKEDGEKLYRPHIKGDAKVKEKNIYNSKFWAPIFKDTDFTEYMQKRHTFQGDFDVNKTTFYSDIDQDKKLSEMMAAEAATAANPN